jgi:hypothetical protein
VKPFEWCRRVLADERVTWRGRAVAMTLSLHARGRSSTMSVGSVHRLSGLGVTTCKTGLAELRSAGWVSQVRKRKQNGAHAPSTWLFVDADMPVDEQDLDTPLSRVATKGRSRGDHHGGSRGDHLESKRDLEGWTPPDLWRAP